ncbi:MAG: S26 family signal peptidase [Pseudomonadota bacterium]
MQRAHKVGCSIALIFCLGVAFFLSRNPSPKLLYNPSPSAPTGWYFVGGSGDLETGDLVAAYLSIEAETLAHTRHYLPAGTPIIKTVWAMAGTEYCVQEGWLEVQGQPALRMHTTDSQGRELPVLSDGCRSVSDGKLLLSSDAIETSFDSRYFGEIDESLVLGRVHLIWKHRSKSGGQIRPMGGARGMGAEGKIKGLSSNPPLKPCLHITFHGIKSSVAVPRFPDSCCLTAPYPGSIARSFTELHRIPAL